jgi:acyl-CoA synthetase (AMP-forming)/AMP-acid ligase II
MTVSKWMHVGTVLKMNAINYPDKLGCQDKNKSFTFKEWNARACRLANALTQLGVGYQDRFAIIAYNRVEWLEIYGCCAKGGQVMVPIMFRLAPPEIEYIVNHAECKGVIVEEPFVEIVNSMRAKLLTVPKGNFIYLGEGKAPAGYVGYEEFLAGAAPEEPERMVDAVDMWTIMYTSGTTGRPKGVVKTHESVFGQYYNSNVNQGVLPTDKVLLVMPMCHINSVYYSYAYTLVTAPVMIYNMVSFDPEDMLRTLSDYKITFTSLVPTHYIMMLSLPDAVKKKYDVSSIRQLLISSAPARKDLKVAIMDHFKNAELWEAYGSTEAGLVTLLRPEDQFKKLGSIGREIFGTDRIKILNEAGAEVPDGEVGELYSRTPSIFKEYWKDPEKTTSVFQGEWFSAGDMCRRDEDGYYYLVDRKANMIITGGENVYPSEVENCVGAHKAVKDVAVIGVPDKKWGESVKAIVVLHQGYEPSDSLVEEILESCKGKIAGYKRPKTIDFIKDAEMPRTGTGKILHRILREKYGTWSDQ